MSDAAVLPIEQWLRASGLPYLVDRSRRARGIYARTAPFFILLVLLDAGLAIADAVPGGGDGTTTQTSAHLSGLVLIGVAAPIALAVLATLALRRRGLLRRPVGLAMLGVFLVIDPVVSTVGVGFSSWFANLALDVGIALTAYAVTWLGVGALVAFGVTAGLTQLGAVEKLATRALPLLTLVVIFAFFSAEAWQMTSALSVGRLCAVGGLFVALGTVFVASAARGELREIELASGPAERRTLLSETPFGVHASPGIDQEPTPMSHTERANVLVALLLAQALQVILFGLLVFAFLVVLGMVAMDPAVIRSWAGHPSPPLTFLGTPVPIDQAILRVSGFLAAFAALNFTVSVGTDHSYRTAFYEPLLAEVRVAVAVRATYRGLRS